MEACRRPGWSSRRRSCLNQRIAGEVALLVLETEREQLKHRFLREVIALDGEEREREKKERGRERRDMRRRREKVHKVMDRVEV